MNYKTKRNKLMILLLVVSMAMTTGCIPGLPQREKKKTEGNKETDKAKSEKKAKEEKEKKEDDVIVAGSVDTKSKFSFTVEEALIGMQSYSDEPVVVLASTFTNNSDEAISFSWALDATAKQGGYDLTDAIIFGASEFNYNDIEPGKTIPVFIGWNIVDVENEITLTVIDKQHYAKQEIFSQTFTIDELIKNTENFQDSGEVIDSPLDV